MRILSRCAAALVVVVGTLVVLAAGAPVVQAQCAMMGGSGGHDHAAMQGKHASKPSGSEKKLRQSIDRVLADDRGRAMLTDALLNDRAFMEALVQRLAAIPEWRAMAFQQLSGPAPAGTTGTDSHATPNATSVAYVCPMHPDVVASAPGDCPKCGMALVRKESRRE